MSQQVTVPETPTSLFCRKVFHGPPSRWTEVPVKQLGRLQGGAGFPHAEQGVEYEELEFHKVNALGSSDANGFLTQSENTVSCSTAQRLGAFVFPARSIVFAKVGAALMLSRFRLLRRKACLDNNMMGLVVRGDHSSDFVRYALELFPMGYVVNPGAVPSINERNIGEVSIPVPQLAEQQQIASFLDYETAKIDALMEKQQQLIALLGEKRQAVISHAVTKGLNPDAPMRDSGVEWLGEVPEHWRVGELKRFASVNTGVAKGKDLAGQKTVSVPYLRVANVQDGYLDLDEVTRIDILEHELERYRLRPGDVLMNEGGDFDKLGRGHVWEGQIDPCITQNHVFAVRPTDVLSRWLSCVTSSHYAQFYFKTRAKQSTNLASISSTNLMQLPVVAPPADEQNKILSFIEHSTEKFNRLLDVANSQVDLLQERRTALISAAVTGKIDVRGWKRPSADTTLETEMELA